MVAGACDGASDPGSAGVNVKALTLGTSDEHGVTEVDRHGVTVERCIEVTLTERIYENRCQWETVVNSFGTAGTSWVCRPVLVRVESVSAEVCEQEEDYDHPHPDEEDDDYDSVPPGVPV